MSTTQVGSLVISLEAGVARIQRDMDAVRSNVSSNMAAVRKDSTQAMQAIEQSSQRMAAQVDLSFGRAGNAVRGFIATYAGSRLAEFAKEATLAAAQYNTMGVVMQQVGHNAGYSMGQLQQLEGRLRDTGISAMESRNNITRVIQAHIDLADASKLARVAQDAAVIGNLNSSQSFAQLIHGVQSAQTDVLRGIGINADFEGSYARLAVQLGKSTAQLTENEKMQARVNEVLLRGKDIAGTYEAAMGEAGKQLNSMKRYADDLKVALGQHFMEPFTRGVTASSDALRTLSQHADLLGRGLEYSLVGVGMVAAAKAAGGLQHYTREIWASHTATIADTKAQLGAAAASEQRSYANMVAAKSSQAAAVAEADKAAVLLQSARAETVLAEQEVARAGLQVRLAQGTAAHSAQLAVLNSAEQRLTTAREAETAATAALTQAESRLAGARTVAGSAATSHAAASNALTLAKEREAAATSLAAAAGRTAGSVMAALGGPFGVATIGLGLLIYNWDKLATSAVRAADMATDSANRIKSALGNSNVLLAGQEIATAKQRMAIANENMAKAMHLRDASKNAPKLYEHYDQQLKQWAAIADQAREVALKGEADLNTFKATQRKQAMALIGLDENGQPLAPRNIKEPNYKLGGQLRDRYSEAADKIRQDIVDIQKAVKEGVYTQEEGVKLLAVARAKLSEALRGKTGPKGRSGLSSEDSAIAGLRSRIEEEKQQIAQLQAARGADISKMTEGHKKVIELEQKLAQAKDAGTQASLRKQLALARELDTLNQQTQALQLANQIRGGLYDNPLQALQREHQQRQENQERAKPNLSVQEQARYAMEEDQRYEKERMELFNSQLQQTGLLTEEEQIRLSYERRHDAILLATQVTEDARGELMRRNTEKLNADMESMQNQHLSAMLGSAGQLFDGLAGLAETYGGKQSAMYKTMFALNKATAIGQAIINTEDAATKALTLGFPLGLPAAQMMRALGYASVGVMAGTTIAGMAHDGIDTIPREGTWLLDKGERVVDSRTNADLKAFLQRVSQPAGQTAAAPEVRVTIINQSNGSQASVEERHSLDGSRDILVLVRNLADQRIADATRPGGQIYDFVKGS
ncbi:hypothetical protein [Aquitalea pelogenes]|uniref:hypothetical protein n=1 Tax=Aquitalea pelogenes TaxID=1293573 RepID=UPI0035AF460B